MINIIKHPLVSSKLTKMRMKDTPSTEFAKTIHELASFMTYEVTKDLETSFIDIETPLAKTRGFKLKRDIVLVPILRAGLGLVEAFRSMIPEALVGHIGLYRNEKTLEPVEYYCKMPERIKNADVIILDPMLATGNSTNAAIKLLKKFEPKSIRVACVVSAPAGLETVQNYDKNIDIYTCSIDEKLNEVGYIVPGLGDAGDRIFGTKE